VRRSRSDEPNGEGGPEEAAAFIAESAAELAGLARRHKLHMLGFPLGMTQLEAEEHLRLRSKRALS
jgi:Pyruvate/2-oxoacid:ferredoxin oxidoreductase gamma subunit